MTVTTETGLYYLSNDVSTAGLRFRPKIYQDWFPVSDVSE